MKHAHVILGVVVALFVTTFDAAGQSFQGGLRGTVRDAQGVIPGVTVVLTNQETSVARDTASNNTGEYSFPGVAQGIYTVRASVSGFKTFERKDARIGTQQTTRGSRR
jgi:carboxypeptidase family protein